MSSRVRYGLASPPSPLANLSSPFAVVMLSGGVPRVFPVSMAAVVMLAGGLLGLVCGVIATGYYVAFRDQVLARLMNQQTDMQYAYEERIATLRQQIDRLASRQVLDQDTIEGRIRDVLARQAALEHRHEAIQRLSARLRIDLPTTAGAAGTEPSRTGSLPRTPRPIGGPEEDFRPDSRSETRSDRGAFIPQDGSATSLLAAKSRLATLSVQQETALALVAHSIERRHGRLAKTVAETGLDMRRFALAATAGTGGPLVPLAGQRGDSFDHQIERAALRLGELERLSAVVRQLPLSRPMPVADITSAFGPRRDPFTRGLAMHTGVDFRAATGTPVRAGAPGVVREADWAGGYGLMVEIDHGHGVTTRYAHLSAVDVDVGDRVAAGALIGRAGSTGRSTGPHLHYEVRVDGEPVDPMRFMRAGALLRDGP